MEVYHYVFVFSIDYNGSVLPPPPVRSEYSTPSDYLLYVNNNRRVDLSEISSDSPEWNYEQIQFTLRATSHQAKHVKTNYRAGLHNF